MCILFIYIRFTEQKGSQQEVEEDGKAKGQAKDHHNQHGFAK